ncbi:phage tail tape measure protein [Listeria monocytogenes]|uniref:phage tail tape measure protein n=10 Tax=Bacteria TaxID=2 RepID=UPI000742FD87|nr:phage tail tape measure protein [Listeria monocytogenes]ALX68719.1 phage tail tape measure protein [Listeria monocytogenes]EAE3915686.1 phage tail tape measure protein [Listeria monocytogenes]HCH7027664.1 phage tail tape measure protein [Listeria monocytogenes]HCH9939990.1 phage tail tape measure protein [Listeria monocytogenes]
MNKLQGLSINLDLDATRVDEGMKGLKRTLGSVNSEMKANLSAFGKGEKTLSRYETELDGLNKKLSVQSKMVSQTKNDFKDLEKRNASLNGELKESNKTLTESKKRFEQLSKSGNATEKELKEAEKEVNSNQKAYNKLNKELQQMPKALSAGQKAVNNEVANYNNLQRKIDTTTESYKKFKREQAVKSSPWGAVTQDLDKYQKKLNETGDKLVAFGKKGSLYMAPVAFGLGFATKKAADFEQQMSNTLSVMSPGEVNQYKDALRELAIQQGADTKYSALEAAQAQEELLKAGLSVKDVINGGLSGALSLATAGELDLASAAEIAATVLNAFKDDNLSVADAANILAGAANASATGVEEMKMSLQQVSAVASGVGLSFDDTSTMLAVFAQNGLKGSDAGTSLKTMLQRLHPTTKAAWQQFDALGLSIVDNETAMKVLQENGVKPLSNDTDKLMGQIQDLAKSLAGPKASASKVNKEFEELTVSTGAVHSAFYDTNGELKSAEEISGLLQSSLKDLNSEQRSAALGAMFGSDAVRAGNIAYREGADGIKKMRTEMGKVTADDVAKMKMDNLKGTIEEISGAIETFAISIGTSLTPVLRGLGKYIQKAADWFNGLNDSTKTVISTAGVVAVAIPVAGLAFGFIAKGASEAIKPVKALTAALAKNSVAATENAIVSRADGAAMSTVGKGTKGKGLINGLGNLIGLGGKKGAGLKGAAKSADYAKDIAMYSKGGRIGKYIGAAGKVGKGVPVLGTALAATQLIGINKKNAGGKIGGTVGGIAGGAGAGALVGSFAGPVGTVIGGALGGIIGSGIGKSIGKSIQKEMPAIKKTITNTWGDISDWAEKHPILGHPINQINTVAKMAKKAGKEIKTFFSDPLQTSFSGKGISKGTAKNINAYSKMSQNAITELKSLELTGDKISKSTSDKISKNFDGMVTLVEKSFGKTKEKSDKNLNSLAKSGMLSSEEVKAAQTTRDRIQKLGLDEIKKNNNKIKSLNKEMATKNKAITSKETAEINAIRKKAANQGRTTTKEEERQISAIKRRAQKEREASNRLYSNKIQSVAKKQETVVVANLSKSAKEQKLILGKLKDSSGKLSAQQASKIVKESKRAKEGAIDQANKKYKGVVKKADEEYYVNGTITKKQHDDIVKKAKSQKNKSVSEAKKMHNGVVDQAKKQASGHLKQVDWETGETLSKWDNFKVGLAKAVNWVTGGINKVLKFFGIKEIPLWKPKGSDNDTSSKSKKIDTKRRTSYGSNLAMDYTGSNNASGQIMAGEEGFEIAYNKRNAQAQILGANGAEITHVAPGTKILNHADSKKVMQGGLGKTLPGFANGNSSINDFLSDAWDGTKAVAGKVVDFSKKAFDWAAHPIKNLNKLFGGLSVGVKMGNDGNLGSDVLNYLKNSIGSPLEKMLSGFKETAPVAGPAGKGASAWSSVIKKAALAMKVDLSGGELKGIIAQIHRESGGNEKITQSSAVVDVNTLSGNPAKGLLQYIPQTFNAYRMKGHNNIFSGYDQLLAFFNNSSWRNDLPYGKRGWGPRGHRRFANGGFVNKNEMIEVAENNKPEVVIPLTRKNRAVQLIKKTKEIIGINDGGSVVVNSPDNSEMVLLLQQQNQILMQLLQKNSDVYLDVDKVGKLVEAVITKTQNNRISRKDRVQGVRTTWQK